MQPVFETSEIVGVVKSERPQRLKKTRRAQGTDVDGRWMTAFDGQPVDLDRIRRGGRRGRPTSSGNKNSDDKAVAVRPSYRRRPYCSGNTSASHVRRMVSAAAVAGPICLLQLIAPGLNTRPARAGCPGRGERRWAARCVENRRRGRVKTTKERRLLLGRENECSRGLPAWLARSRSHGGQDVAA